MNNCTPADAAPPNVRCQTNGPLGRSASDGADNSTTTGSLGAEALPATSVCAAVRLVAPAGRPSATRSHVPAASAVVDQARPSPDVTVTAAPASAVPASSGSTRPPAVSAVNAG